MIATATETLGETRVLRQQMRVTHQAVKRNLEGMTQEDSLIQPQPGGNCLNWVIGHLLYVDDMILSMLGQAPLLGTDTLARYGRGTAQLTNAAEALHLDRLMAAWNEAYNRIEAGLDSLTPEVLDRPAPFSPTNDPKETVGSLLPLLIFHQAYHAGQTGLLRRMAGKEGALP